MFALIADCALCLKADAINRPDFEALDLPPFTYDKGGKPVKMSYFRAPSAAEESPPKRLEWAHKSVASAART